MQSIINKSDFIDFLLCGALLQESLDQFKLIWGPFEPINFDHNKYSDEKTIIYRPDFWNFLMNPLNLTMGFNGQREARLSRQELLSYLDAQTSRQPQVNWGKADEDNFKLQFQWSQENFKSKKLLKSVPIVLQTAEVDYTVSDLVFSLRSLLSAQHFGSAYGYWQNGEGFLGQSPEVILNWKASDKILRTAALAGTTEAGAQGELQIISDNKIKNEHQLVVDDLKLALSNYDLKIEKQEILRLKHLNHLITRMHISNVELKEINSYVEKIHPTAALGLYPRVAEMYEQLKNFDLQKRRKNFAAPFGFFNKSQIQVIASIRNYCFNSTNIAIFSGCGITAESDFKTELSEVENKRNSVKKMMGFNL